MQQGLELVEDRLHDALDEVATLKAEAASKVLRSKKQPPAKVRFDKEHYSTASTILTKRERSLFQAVCDDEGCTVSTMLRQFVRGKIRHSGFR